MCGKCGSSTCSLLEIKRQRGPSSSEGKQGWDDLSIWGKLLNPEMLCLSVKWEFFFKGGGVYGGNSSVLLIG